MPLSKKGYDFESLSYKVIGACIDVQRQLGLHCKEEDNQRALALALKIRDIRFERESVVSISEFWRKTVGYPTVSEYTGKGNNK